MPKTWGLGLYTCGAWLGLALMAPTGQLRAAQWLEGRQMSESLLPRLAEFLKPLDWQDLAWVAVVAGPGSFTSLRLGMVTARTLGQALEIPVFTRSALFCAIWGNLAEIAVVMQAHGGQVYGAVYRDHLPIHSEQLLTLEQWQILASTYPQRDLDALPATDLVKNLVLWANQAYSKGERPTWQQAIPMYLQPFPR